VSVTADQKGVGQLRLVGVRRHDSVGNRAAIAGVALSG
jgi:hypothetical protein